MDPSNVHQQSSTNLAQTNDFELQDFIDDPNFDQFFINLIRGENKDVDAISNFDYSSLIDGSLVDNNSFISFPPTNAFDQCYNDVDDVVNNVCDPSSTFSSFSCFDDGEVMKGEEELGGGREENDDNEDEDEDEDEDSSATTINNTATTSANGKPRPKTDRSKTLISERRRRGRMKEKLYALRALVPNITKMDKASIIGDAVSYVHELQAQAKKLKTEVAGLEASLLVSQKYEGTIQNPIKVHFTNNIILPNCKKIIQMDMFQVDERGFYVKIVCNKGEGVVSSLYMSLESLSGFNVQNSNLVTISDSFLLTFLLSVKGSMAEVNLPNLRLWMTGAFLNQGFEFTTSLLP